MIYGGDLRAQRAPDLHGDVPQSSDAKNRQSLAARNLRLLECPKHRDARTEKGGCFNGGKTVWDFQSVARRRSCKFRVAAINGHAGDLLPNAKILVPFAAEFAIAATPVEPWHTDTVADLQIADPAPFSTTRPTISCPRISGFLTIFASCGQSPSATCKSEWHTPQASTAIRTSSSAGFGRIDFFES